MIVKFAKDGTSFKGVIAYLTHDPDKAKTDERVGWTHTLNLVHDDMPSAVHEMFTTCRNADVLKQEAGVRPGGRDASKVVKHVSLNWHPSERPAREEKIAAAISFLKHMDWAEHQVALINHTDKEHAHVHLVINAIHPVTGLKLNDDFERRRAQEWAKAYELERGTVFCVQRMKSVAEREVCEPRPAWMAIKEQALREAEAERQRLAFDPSYLAREENRTVIKSHEWELLKEQQKEQRLAFFSEGKQLYKELNRAVYREVRGEFREAWGSYYAAKRQDIDLGTLSEVRADLIARQKEILEERREAAAAPVRAEREKEYRALLDGQKDARADLRARQERGLSSPRLLDGSRKDELSEDRLNEALDRFGIRRGRVADETAEQLLARHARWAKRTGPVEAKSVSSKPAGVDLRPKNDVASGLAGGLLSLIGGIGDSFTGGHAKPPRKAPEVDPLERFGIRRGVPPDPEEAKRAARDKDARDAAWETWKDRLLDR